MTWEELVEFAKDYGFESDGEKKGGRSLSYKFYYTLLFFDYGEIYIEYDGSLIAKNRTYEQMKAIIENMFDKTVDE